MFSALMRIEIQKYREIPDISISFAENSANIENISEWIISALPDNLPFGNYASAVSNEPVN